jgi:peptidoglycan hydrolase-like protein with peptidoglycan-binding domain
MGRGVLARHGVGRRRYLALALVLLAAALVVIGGILIVSSKASLGADSDALAKVGLPFGGGKVQSITVLGRQGRPIPVDLRGGKLWPRRAIQANELLSIDVIVRRPGWISWLSGKTERLRIQLRAPASRLRQRYLTLRGGQPLRLEFNPGVRVLAYGQSGQLRKRTFATPKTEVTLPRSAEAGTIAVAATPRTWETTPATIVSWFPAGAAASAVASPAPGTQILPGTPITLTFSKPVANAIGSSMPPVSPITPGTWHPVNSHTIVFRPEGPGYGLGATVNIPLPSGVRLVGAHQGGSASTGTWSVPQGSTLRLQQILATLGYLPFKFKYTGQSVGPAVAAQEAAAITPPAGSFAWRYGNVPGALKSSWKPGASGVMTKGALMAFQSDHGLTTDGLPGPAVWNALISADLAGRRSTFGYTYVTVSTASQSLALWHNGQVMLTTAVNTGIASRPTATGTYPVYEHISSGTMSGTNPDGSHYNDPGIQWISYFNGGDALHAFTRAQYGFPQSLGCVEMQLAPAAKVWPYTPIGTLVHVA